MTRDADRLGLTVEAWRDMAQRSAAERQLPELVPLIGGLASSVTTLRRAHATLQHPDLVATPTPPSQS